MISSIKLTVFFSEPFWIGVFESYENDVYKVCKVTFGSEPKVEEVYNFILRNFNDLNFSNSLEVDIKQLFQRKVNPKRLQRKIKQETKTKGIGTQAQIALKQQYEENKLINKKLNKEQKDEMQERKFQLRKMKKKEKLKGH